MTAAATRALIEHHWALANARQWDAFATLLAPALRYDVPQTREYIEGGEGYLDMFRTWPGDWHVTIRRLVCEAEQAVCVIDFDVGAERMTGISVFSVDAGRITQVIDYWPESYEPPPRVSPWLKRRSEAT